MQACEQGHAALTCHRCRCPCAATPVCAAALFDSATPGLPSPHHCNPCTHAHAQLQQSVNSVYPDGLTHCSVACCSINTTLDRTWHPRHGAAAGYLLLHGVILGQMQCRLLRLVAAGKDVVPAKSEVLPHCARCTVRLPVCCAVTCSSSGAWTCSPDHTPRCMSAALLTRTCCAGPEPVPLLRRPCWWPALALSKSSGPDFTNLRPSNCTQVGAQVTAPYESNTCDRRALCRHTACSRTRNLSYPQVLAERAWSAAVCVSQPVPERRPVDSFLCYGCAS